MSIPNKTRYTNKNASQSQSIVQQGARGVSTRGNNANETALIPASTLRALQLRNGKHGSFGTGEIIRIPGREKLELIAEEEMKKADEERRTLYEANINTSVKAPFQLETVLKIAQSQMDAYIDLINALHNPDLCCDIVLRETEAHCPPTISREDKDYLRIPSFVAEQFAICVHNTHMLASGWVILYESLRKFQEMGLRDREVYAQLTTDDSIRDIYVSAYDLLKKVVSALQQRLRSIVQNTPHFAPYFRDSNDVQDCQEIERAEIKKMYKSFLDSTIIELCLPGSKFSPQALYFCLHATQEETPKLLKRCPQLMWDAVGDLSEAVRLLDIMESPLINKDNVPKTDEGSTFAEFDSWDEAQHKSVKAAMDISSFVNLVNPLTNLQNRKTLNKVWDNLNANYLREAGQNIDTLWHLVDSRHRVPHFSTLIIPSEALYGSRTNGRELVRRGQNLKKKSEAVVNGYDSNDSMPSLKAVSDSEDEYQEWTSDDDSDEEDEGDDYDEDEEADLKRKQREAIDRSLEDPDVLDLNNDRYAEERSKNPFLSLLGNLRGRIFSSSAILRTDGETTATSRPTRVSTRKKSAAEPTAVPRVGDKATPRKDVSRKTTLEGADDGSDEQKGTSEKKKKAKKKKKKKSINVDAKSLPDVTPASPVPEPPRTPSPPPRPPQPAASTSPVSPKTEKPKRKSPSVKTQSTISNLSGTTTTAFGSTTTLPLPHEEKAPSARTYLKELAEAKTKVKTRREPATETIPEKKERRNLFDKLRGKDRDVPKEDAKRKNSADVFGRLKRKTVSYARKLIGASVQDKKGSLKWEQFLQVMRELGFEYDPSTAGSSVRFDPPNPNDRSITFHKPHPDSTLYPYLLREYRFKLEAYYGWSPEKFEKAVQGLGSAPDEDDD